MNTAPSVVSRLSVTAVVHRSAGSPPIDGAARIEAMAPCALCGAPVERGLPYRAWAGANFADHNRLAVPGAQVVCEPCAYATSWVAPPDRAQAPAEGKKRVRSLRMYAHLWDDGAGYWSADLSQRDAIREWLRDQDGSRAWWAAIPTSGKKHLLPSTVANPRGARPGLVRFEEQSVAIGDWRLVSEIGDLLAVCSRRNVLSGEYHAIEWKKAKDQIRDFERRWSALRASGWFALACWLAPGRVDPAEATDDAG